MEWKQWLGAVPEASGTRFRVWAPKAQALSVQLVDGPLLALRPEADGYFAGFADGVRAGARYFYRFADGRERPDPASLLQPLGVHGPSEVVDLAAIAPRRPSPRVPLAKLVFCEIHLGTFTPAGTADAAAQFMPELAEALYTAVEVMPVAAFSGDRGWGYDGVAPFAAHAAYGGPAALARLVDAAHAAGLSAFLDVVYNHLGPEGNYLAEFGPYFTAKHKTPWGDALDFSLPPVRRYFIDNALRWVAAGGFDGLRLDAVHGIVDDSPKHILREIAEAVHAAGGLVIAESDQNDVKLVEQEGLDGSWADDLHHALHVALTGETTGYYADFEPLGALAKVLTRGFFHDGTFSSFRARSHGRPIDTERMPAWRLVVASQNHDQIGNRAIGDRLSAQLDPGQLAIAATLTLLGPFTPMLFMGEEWGARTPWQFFTSHSEPELGEATARGRINEFARMGWDPALVPDPQDPATFARSKLDWNEPATPGHARLLAFYRSLAALRRSHSDFTDPRFERVEVRFDETEHWLRLRRGDTELLVNLGEVPRAVPTGGEAVLVSFASAEAVLGREAGSLLLAPHSVVVTGPAQ